MSRSAALRERYGPAALITGASSGIGAEYARYLAARGFALALVARRGDRLQSLARELSELGCPHSELFATDLTRAASVSSLVAALAEGGMRIGLLINNAGFGRYGAFRETDLADQRALLELNAGVTLELTHRLLPVLGRRARSGIVIVSSTVAHMPSPYFTTYAATKAFDLLFAEGLYHELKPHGIDVLAILPGLTRTEFHDVAGIDRERIPFPFREPRQVVATSFRHLGKRPSVTDGLANKALLFAARHLPRRLFGAVNARFLRGD